MKNRKMLLPALLSIVVVFSLIVPASAAELQQPCPCQMTVLSAIWR